MLFVLQPLSVLTLVYCGGSESFMFLSLAVGVAGASHRHLEVGGRLVLQLICQGVDLEPVQSEKK
jgi:hypothetical protein